jgi:rare lipoprotein A
MIMKHTPYLAYFTILAVIIGCQQNDTSVKGPADNANIPKGGVVKQQGPASWYGDDFHGKPTASGETYNQNALTAASKTLPLGTVAQVTNVDTGKSVTVKVNDRGPYVGNRVMDLSKAAAKKIDLKEQGVGKVKIVAHKPLKKQKYKRKHH